MSNKGEKNTFREKLLQDMNEKGITEDEETAKIVKLLWSSENWEIYQNYMLEVIDRCARLVKIHENERAEKEFEFMILNIRKEAGL